MLAATVHAQQERDCKAAVETDRCLVCLGPPREPMRLPCGHSFCAGCVGELRSKGVTEACPLCRAELPPGPDGLFELAVRAYWRVGGMVERGEVSSASLPAVKQKELDQAVAVLTDHWVGYKVVAEASNWEAARAKEVEAVAVEKEKAA